MIFDDYLDELKKSPWPKCIELANEIARLPGSAATLEAATRTPDHHVRSAALKALASIAPARAKIVAMKLINDRSYEVRMDALAIAGAKAAKRIAELNAAANERRPKKRVGRPPGRKTNKGPKPVYGGNIDVERYLRPEGDNEPW